MKIKTLALLATLGLVGCDRLPETVVGQIVSVDCGTTCNAWVKPLVDGKFSDTRIAYPTCNGNETMALIDKKAFGMRTSNVTSRQCMRFSEYR